MLISKNEIKNTIREVENIRDIYRLHYLGADSTERSVNNLLDLCRTYLEKKIDLQLHNDSALNHLVQSFVLVKDSGYEICILNDLNNCWKRFVLCKELFHIVLDSEESRNPSLEEHLDDFFGGVTNLEHRASTVSARTEYLAEFAAMEFLFPYAERVSLLSGNKDISAIAERYKIPRYFAERYLTKRYIENFRDV